MHRIDAALSFTGLSDGKCTIRNGKRVEVRGGGEENRSEGSLKAKAKVKGKKRKDSL